MRISKLPLLSHDGVAMEILMHAHSFCRSVLSEYHGFFMRSSAAFVLLRLLRSFVERFYLSKKYDCKNSECVNLSFKCEEEEFWESLL